MSAEAKTIAAAAMRRDTEAAWYRTIPRAPNQSPKVSPSMPPPLPADEVWLAFSAFPNPVVPADPVGAHQFWEMRPPAVETYFLVGGDPNPMVSYLGSAREKGVVSIRISDFSLVPTASGLVWTTDPNAGRSRSDAPVTWPSAAWKSLGGSLAELFAASGHVFRELVGVTTAKAPSAAPGRPEQSVPPLAAALLAATDEAAVDAVFDDIFDLVAEVRTRADLAPCDALLCWLAQPAVAGRLHVGVLLAVLRLTSALREDLPHWIAARDSVAVELQHRDEDVSALLCGLQG